MKEWNCGEAGVWMRMDGWNFKERVLLEVTAEHWIFGEPWVEISHQREVRNFGEAGNLKQTSWRWS
jgi:hypothetical protein